MSSDSKGARPRGAVGVGRTASTGHGFTHAYDRLAARDAARTAQLAKDPRVYEPDADEETTRLCGARKGVKFTITEGET